MDDHRDVDDPSVSPSHAGPDDHFLVAQLLAGDAAALRALLTRYDRLVRYTVFRLSGKQCARDPQWLDSVASASWAGFVSSLQRLSGDLPRSVRGYLVQISSNQTISALRRVKEPLAGLEATDTRDPSLIDPIPGPDQLAANLEEMALLRDCLSDLPAESKRMVTQLAAITERRWEDAANALGLSESTLRSRWRVILSGLKKCIADKMGKDAG